MAKHLCEGCGKPTGEHEFFRVGEERHWMHVRCIMGSGEELVASGALDDLEYKIDWGDGATSITTGRQLRQQQPHMSRA